MGECWGEGTATFMILGLQTPCGFCGVKTGRPETVDWDEPEKVARSNNEYQACCYNEC
jgi:lipoic acid synthetase